MNNLFDYGNTPVYDPFQYNNDYEVGKLLIEITRVKSQGRRLGIYYREFIGTDLRIKQQFILRLARVLSGAFNTSEIHLAWMTFQNNATLDDLYQRSLSIITEIWFNSEDIEQPESLAKLLSISNRDNNNIDNFLNNDFLPILFRINNQKMLILVFDFQTDSNESFQSNLRDFQKSLSCYVKEKNIFFFILGNEIKRSNQIQIHEPNPSELKSSIPITHFNFIKSSDNISKHETENIIKENICWLKPLSIISHPADNEMIEFISSYFENLDDQLKVLGQKRIVNFLKDSGISLNGEFSSILREISKQTIIKDEHLLSLGLSGTGLDNKERLKALINRFDITKSHWKVLSSYFQAHGSTALALGITGQEKLCDWHIDSVIEAIKDDEFIKNILQVRSMMDYTGQILLVTQEVVSENNKKHFIKLLEGVADRYSSFLRNKPNCSPNILLEASRYQYKVGHIYDRLFNKMRYYVQNRERNTSYESAAAVLEIPLIENQYYESIIYRKGTALSKINKGLAFKHYVEYANIIFNHVSRQKDQFIQSTRINQHSAEELATYAIKTNIESNPQILEKKLGRIIKKLLQRTGAKLTTKEYYSAVSHARPSKICNVTILEKNNNVKISIYTSKADLHTALIISENIFSETFIVPTINIVSISNKVPFKANLKDDYHIIIGAPDTSDGIGEIVVDYDPMLDRTYHLRMDRDFCEPVIIENVAPQTLILCASGINGIINAWSIEYNKFIQKLKSKNNMETFLIGTILAALLKRIGSRSIDLLFDKVLKKNSQKEKSSEETLVERINSEGGNIPKSEIKEILKELDPPERNEIISTIQQEQESIMIIVNSILEKLDIDNSVEEIRFFSETFWGFSRDIEKSNLTIQQRTELHEFIKGFNNRYDSLKKIETKFRTQGILNEEDIAQERVTLFHQALNFKDFLKTVLIK
ncbi:MAG: hypothetical protein KAT68_19500 [Bacteroidales bacterium]|nr:hypothetical protein [Bacteroidales bacterium]